MPKLKGQFHTVFGHLREDACKKKTPFVSLQTTSFKIKRKENHIVTYSTVTVHTVKRENLSMPIKDTSICLNYADLFPLPVSEHLTHLMMKKTQRLCSAHSEASGF